MAQRHLQELPAQEAEGEEEVVAKAAPETALVKATLELLELMGYMAWRNNKGAARIANARGKPRFVRFGGKAGASDVFAILDRGRFLAAEAKIGSNQPSEDQRRFMIDVNRAGGLAFPYWSLGEFIERMEREGYNERITR